MKAMCSGTTGTLETTEVDASTASRGLNACPRSRWVLGILVLNADNQVKRWDSSSSQSLAFIPIYHRSRYSSPSPCCWGFVNLAVWQGVVGSWSLEVCVVALWREETADLVVDAKEFTFILLLDFF